MDCDGNDTGCSCNDCRAAQELYARGHQRGMGADFRADDRGQGIVRHFLGKRGQCCSEDIAAVAAVACEYPQRVHFRKKMLLQGE